MRQLVGHFLFALRTFRVWTCVARVARIARSIRSVHLLPQVSVHRAYTQRNATQHTTRIRPVRCPGKANSATTTTTTTANSCHYYFVIVDRFPHFHFPIASAATVARSVPFRSVFSRAARLPSVLRLLSVGCRLSSAVRRLSSVGCRPVAFACCLPLSFPFAGARVASCQRRVWN